MKKILSIVICILMLSTTVVFAEESRNITDKLNDIWLSSIEDIEVLDNIKRVNQQKKEEDIALYLIAPGYARQKIGISADNKTMEEQVKRKYEIYQDSILKIYYLRKNKNSNQYAEANCLKYLISDDYYLYMEGYDYNIDDNTGEEIKQYMPHRYCSDGTVDGYNQFHKEYCYSGGMSEEGYEFLKNAENIKNMLSKNDIYNVEEMKVVIIGNDSTCLYIRTLDSEYLVRLYVGTYYNAESDNPYNKNENWIEELELFKLYNAKDFFKTVSDEMNEMNEVKPTYETEALNLYNNGVLYGNENGLDLLKPLSRIEATTILVRILGLENQETSATSYFADISSDNWGAKYANIAYDAGITKGVDNGNFAPNQTITSSQFVTLLLRSQGETEIDWQTAINLLVEREIITQAQADKMDLFTRGDMAKIIYEFRNRGLINN